VVPIVEAVPQTATKHSSFTRYAWGVLGWNFLVVLWGAYVRASGSGAGCGSEWPLCKGEVVPQASRLDTIIEFAHRATSGVALAAVIALAVWSIYRFPRGHRVRRAATLSVVFVIFEVLLGAGIVLFRYVAQNASVGRAFYLSLHLVNTQLLLAVLTLTAWFSRDDSAPPHGRSTLVVATLPVVLLVSVSGAIAALGDTLFPATSLAEGMRQDVSATAHFLLRLRVLHPALAILGAAFCVFTAVRVLRSAPRRLIARIAFTVMLVSMAQLMAGAMNIALLAPIWMQLAHLFLADVLWLSLVLLAIESG
jgi:heme A synthase